MFARRAMRRGAAVALISVVAAASASAASAQHGRDGDGDDATGAAASVPAPLGDIDARAWVLVLERSGQIIASSNASAELPIASTTKLMTAYVTLHHEALSKMLVEQPYVPTEGESLAPVPAGARLSVPDMLRAMLLPSGNNVAYSLSVDVAGSTAAFVGEMNAAAAALGLGRTHYTTPIGLDTPPGNYSTAIDLARLARVLMRDQLVREIVDEPSARLADGIVVDNRNDLVGTYPWVVGVKTGNTFDAGECLVGAADLNGVRLISVVLGAPSEAARDSDTLALLRYGLGRYRSAQISLRGHVYASVPVAGRRLAVKLVAARSSKLVLARKIVLHVALRAPAHLHGPLAAGAVGGSLAVTEDGRTVESVPLLTARAVPPPPPRAASNHLRPAVWLAAGGGLAIVLVGCSLPFMRRRATRSAPGLDP
jgi:D-alanyl-D-alanine carboxypeptidase (penicillin-binding protein 5/6)